MREKPVDIGQESAGDVRPVSVREVLQLLLEADKYPVLGNGDWAVATVMEKEALVTAETAVSSSTDPPEFRVWLETLRKGPLSVDEREIVYSALHDYFEDEEEACSKPRTIPE